MATFPTNGAATRSSIFPQLLLNAELWCDTGDTPIGGAPSLPQVFRGDMSPRNTTADKQGGYSNPLLVAGTEGSDLSDTEGQRAETVQNSHSGCR